MTSQVFLCVKQQLTKSALSVNEDVLKKKPESFSGNSWGWKLGRHSKALSYSVSADCFSFYISIPKWIQKLRKENSSLNCYFSLYKPNLLHGQAETCSLCLKATTPISQWGISVICVDKRKCWAFTYLNWMKEKAFGHISLEIVFLSVLKANICFDMFKTLWITNFTFL